MGRLLKLQNTPKRRRLPLYKAKQEKIKEEWIFMLKAVQAIFLLDLGVMKSPIVKVQYSNNGGMLCAGCQHGNVEVFYLGAKTEIVVLKGHTGAINSIHWSANEKFVVVASADKSASLWQASGTKRGELLLRMNYEQTNVESVMLQKKALAETTLSKEVKKAQFYYQDLLLALGFGNSLCFYSYEMVDPKLKDDVKRLQSKVRYKAVQKYNIREAQGITAFDLHNRIRSHLAVVSGTNKSLYLYDVNMDEEVSCMKETHGRNIHTVKFAEGSEYGESQASMYNIFASSSLDSQIKLWDVRTNVPIRVYADHTNRMLPLGLSFSPCTLR
eukprot:TRINITY_DN42758_c0_g1_i1.p1 TRINITY_DN42758_c0_g1~~TRINITY_DN42758_c0_g1_i1.p1  ORF type:complete len:328 (+),score=27.34 TRINITY_DN42758_c0_g1_i1:167-1150(+)